MVFSIPLFTTIGDEYDKRQLVDERSRGKTFLCPGPKKGHMPDALFTKEFRSINEGDPYTDPSIRERRERMEKENKKITSTGFRLASFPQKGSGLGSYYGCFQNLPWPHEVEYNVPRKGEKIVKKEIEKRNIYSGPTKKGTYGVVGTTLSSLGQDYVADFYDAPQAKEREERKKSHALMKGAPFKAACRLGGTFDEAMGTGISKCYTLTAPLPPKKMAIGTSMPYKKIENPWKPAGPVPKQRPIEYREDPFDGFDPRVGTKKVKHSDKASWRPGGATNSSWYTKSIAFARL